MVEIRPNVILTYKSNSYSSIQYLLDIKLGLNINPVLRNKLTINLQSCSQSQTEAQYI